jgi:hypothetical protein
LSMHGPAGKIQHVTWSACAEKQAVEPPATAGK